MQKSGSGIPAELLESCTVSMCLFFFLCFFPTFVPGMGAKIVGSRGCVWNAR
jgi:hypothetical protein